MSVSTNPTGPLACNALQDFIEMSCFHSRFVLNFFTNKTQTNVRQLVYGSVNFIRFVRFMSKSVVKQCNTGTLGAWNTHRRNTSMWWTKQWSIVKHIQDPRSSKYFLQQTLTPATKATPFGSLVFKTHRVCLAALMAFMHDWELNSTTLDHCVIPSWRSDTTGSLRGREWFLQSWCH